MDWLTISLNVCVLSAVTVSVAITSNIKRRKRNFSFELTPNCLLTKWPILFVSGKRSLFYFSSYWNVYPEFLTEHGYEVYHLNLPWYNSEKRLQLFDQFLSKQQNRKFHFIVDDMTRKEFAQLWKKHSERMASLNTLHQNMAVEEKMNILDKTSYTLHKIKMWPEAVPSPHVLGVSKEGSVKNAKLLLQTCHDLAEQDLLSS